MLFLKDSDNEYLQPIIEYSSSLTYGNADLRPAFFAELIVVQNQRLDRRVSLSKVIEG